MPITPYNAKRGLADPAGVALFSENPSGFVDHELSVDEMPAALLVLTNLEAWIRRRLSSYLWRQWQNGRNRFKELRRRGVPKFNAAVAAGSPTGFWRMSGHPAVPAP